MEYQIVTLEEKKIVGLTARTSNTDPKMGETIGALWQQFFTQGVFQAIPNKSGTYTIGLYSGYESDFRGAYDITVGCEVKAPDACIPGTVVKTIPAGKYADILLNGTTVDVVAEAWNEIWRLPLERAYTADFEEYRSSAAGKPEEVHLFIALK